MKSSSAWNISVQFFNSENIFGAAFNVTDSLVVFRSMVISEKFSLISTLNLSDSIRQAVDQKEAELELKNIQDSLLDFKKVIQLYS